MRELKKRKRLLEQENEILRRAAAYLAKDSGAMVFRALSNQHYNYHRPLRRERRAPACLAQHAQQRLGLLLLADLVGPGHAR